MQTVGADRQTPTGSVWSLRKIHLISRFTSCSAKTVRFGEEGPRDIVQGSIPGVGLSSGTFPVLLLEGQFASERVCLCVTCGGVKGGGL